MDLGLADQVFVVSGSSRGLGRATAEVLVAEGARVLLTARDGATLAELATTLGGAQHAVGVPADLVDPAAAERVVAAALARYGRLDGALVSCGGPPAGTALATSDEEWRAGFEGAFLGPLRLARSVAGALTDGGSIALVLSSSVNRPLPELATSNGLRPGMANLVRQLATELGPRRVRVNGLVPGRIDTDRVRQLDARAGRAETVRRRHEESIPLGRYGDPVEFGTVAAFVLSSAASYVDGALIAVDGGGAGR